jgi:two-component system, chemotaxis family, response regulator Rcp1
MGISMPPTEKSYRLLVVEDNPGDVFLIKKALRDQGIPAEVTVCADGESAIRLIDSMHEGALPNAIIVDLALPRMGGLEVLRTLTFRPSFVGVPIMVFTSSPSLADKQRVQLLNRVRYVQKPTGVDSFLNEVSQNVKAMLFETAAG